MTLSVLAIGDPTDWLGSPRGVSPDALRLQELWENAREASRPPARLATEYLPALAELDSLGRVADAGGDLEEGERPLQKWSWARAMALLTRLPCTLPAPEVAQDADGEIVFEWHGGPGRTVLLSVGGDGTLHFAALTDGEEFRGKVRCEDGLPTALLALLGRIRPGSR